MYETIKLLHRLNFINGSMWSQAIRKRGEPSVVRVAAGPIDVPVRKKELRIEKKCVGRSGYLFAQRIQEGVGGFGLHLGAFSPERGIMGL